MIYFIQFNSALVDVWHRRDGKPYNSSAYYPLYSDNFFAYQCSITVCYSLFDSIIIIFILSSDNFVSSIDSQLTQYEPILLTNWCLVNIIDIEILL